tara:strand:+ start:552 stop:1172 length:621 start_codon:yes stop_codon:yes gene_type:complete
MSFEQNKYKVIKTAISKELASFCYGYILNKSKVADYLFSNNLISQFDESYGVYNETQIPNTYCCYGDLVMETLLERVLPVMINATGLKLVPTYSYVRLYKYGDILNRHKDRESCEVSCTLNLGGDPWDIFLDSSGGVDNDGTKVSLKNSDMLVYKGCDLEHWREQFEGNNCCQVFLHYNSMDGKFKNNNKYDSRPFLGLPSFCQQK